MATVEDQDQQQTTTPPKEAEIHGDLLETVLSHVPLVDLVFASRVSRSWNNAVSASLRQRHLNKPKPWLILHVQSTRPPYKITTRAYDPRSDTWTSRIHRPSTIIKHVHGCSTVRSLHSNFAYSLSPFHFSFSFDTFFLDWHHVDPPLVWRNDPVVARVGDHVVVGGGGCDFESDPLAMEIYSLKTRTWLSTCDSMPLTFRDSPASLWLSIATSTDKLFVTEKETGLTHWFDPETRLWSDAMVLNPGEGEPVRSYNIGWWNDKLILCGVIGERVKLWRVVGEDFDSCEEIGEMPLDFVGRLKGWDDFGSCGTSVNIRVAGDVMYVYNTAAVEEVVACELVEDGRYCRWWRVNTEVGREELIAGRVVYACSEVGIGDLRRVIKT